MDPGTIEVDRPAGRPQEPSFFLTHGAGGDLSSPGLKGFSAALAAAGHLSVRANLPYRTAGRKTPPAAERSVGGLTALFEEARQQFGPQAIWVAGGRSYGGRVASMAAAEGLAAAGLIFFPYPLHRPGDPSRP
ncbi:MAG: alpha/beta family hydrolase, partial [Actinomycetota bacterium]